MRLDEFKRLYGEPGTILQGHRSTGTGKYRNKKTEYNGVIYDSKREAEFARELDLRVRAGDLKGWRRQVPIELVVNGHLIYRYRIDFVEEHPDGTETYTEIKSEMTAKLRDFVIVWKLFDAIYPERQKRIIM